LRFRCSQPVLQTFLQCLGVLSLGCGRAGVVGDRGKSSELALESADKGLNEAAETLGAGWWDRLVNVTLPLALPGIFAGIITAFAASLGEFGAIITFVANIPGQTRTLPLAIYTALQAPGGETEAARLSVLAIILALIFMTLAEIASRRAQRTT